MTKFYNVFIFFICMVSELRVSGVSCSVGGNEILKEVSFSVGVGEVVVLMGPNGAGKSTVSNVLMGNPRYLVTCGEILLDGKEISELRVDERAKLGLFMSFQNPVEVSGVTMISFLRTAYNAVKGTNINLSAFMKILNGFMDELGLDSKFRSRFVNSGFSGGEKKRAELLQILLLEPKYIVLDEIDSGLDVDGVRLVVSFLKRILKDRGVGVLVITHYYKVLEFLKPDRVLVLREGRIVREGGFEVAEEILENGFR